MSSTKNKKMHFFSTTPAFDMPRNLGEFEHHLSGDRLSTYLRATNGNKESAIYLYNLNTAIGSAFLGPLQFLEVVLRNSMHEKLSECYGENWYENPEAGLDESDSYKIETEKNRLRKRGEETNKNLVTPPHVVAALSFGIWISLLGTGKKMSKSKKADYVTTMWIPALCRAFPYSESITRKKAHNLLDRIRFFRNRVAHHEPIFKDPLQEYYDDIIEAIGWISPDMKNWVVEHNRVEEILLLLSDEAISSPNKHKIYF